MNKDKNKDNPWRAMAVVGAMSADLAVMVIIGVFVGNKLDQNFQSAPIFLIIGLVLGLLLGILSIIKLIKIFLEDWSLIVDSLGDYKLKVIRISKYSFILLFVYLIGVFTPYTSIFLGLLIGTSASLINTIYTAWKVNKIGEIAARTEEHGKTKYASTGMLTRTAFSVLIILFVLQYPQYFNIYSTLIGLFTTQVISVVDSIKHD